MCPNDVPCVMLNLKSRESSAGYATKDLIMYTANSNVKIINVLVYIATESNPDYLGPASLETIAKQVVNSSGSCGTNTEYVLKLAEWMRYAIPSVTDDHLFNLEREVLRILKE